MSLLRVENLCVGFERDLIHQLQLEMNIGDRLIIYGSNGTGKSTLLKALTTPANRKKGDVHWGLPAHEVLHIEQQSGFHSKTPDDVQSYLTNILLFEEPWLRKSESHQRQIDFVLQKLHLPNLPLRHLSGGQRQKLKFAQSLLLKTQVLLLDEPFNAIDQTSTTEIINWLNEIKSQTVQLIVLHDFDQIYRLQSPILWIQPGSWEILSFQDWFQKVDKRFHSWMHAVQASSPFNGEFVL